MVVLAQALVSRPKFVLVDELSLGLAPVVVKRLVPTLEAVAASGVGVLLIEQFAHVALGLAQTAYVIEGGRIHYQGTAQRAEGRARAAPLRLPAARRRPGRRGARVALVGAGGRSSGDSGRPRCRPSAGRSPPPSSGRTLLHEHIVVLQPEALAELRPRLGRELLGRGGACRRRDRRSSAPFATRGIRTLVDPTAPGLGRYIPRIQRINAEVDLNIVVATGRLRLPRAAELPPLPTAEAIAELFVREIREGIDDTGVKAAFLKCAVEEHGLVGDIPRILTRSRRRVETGVPVMVHTNARGADGAARARGADERRRRPGADRDRARGRQQRPRLPAGDRRHRARPRLRPLQHRALQPGRGPDRDAPRAPRGGLRRPDPPLARRGVLLRLHGRRPELRRRASPTTSTSRTTILPALLASAA